MTRRHSTPRAEADTVADMVYALVSELVRQAKTPPKSALREPTGITVDPDFRHYVEQRQTRRKAS